MVWNQYDNRYEHNMKVWGESLDLDLETIYRHLSNSIVFAIDSHTIWVFYLQALLVYCAIF